MEKGASKCSYYINIIWLISAMTCHAHGYLISDLVSLHVTMETMGTRGDIGMWKGAQKYIWGWGPDESNSLQCLDLRDMWFIVHC